MLIRVAMSNFFLQTKEIDDEPDNINLAEDNSEDDVSSHNRNDIEDDSNDVNHEELSGDSERNVSKLKVICLGHSLILGD